ncbi:NDR1/HIN1-like protein 6 [Punica granatum]|uniref:Late embryogenesis abundant protein LEA-2 subgroup domain-containing protein n=2 Tax=Punica granatum TaxID=22663 RepID=A0A218XNK7_PUNGR|nr:NDR1/HIN1-like protein 6 [Punica granatum]OWM86567.1 hypothetical protein CDL15_Pgr015602 [Punica granatum]PKI36211.1 hypothetical protein CRG98_043407 [Punica granatum]
MTDRVYPSAKPPAAAPNGGAPAVNGTAATNGTAPTSAAAAKPQLYRPYRPQPASHRRRHRRRCRCTFCCCCFWTILMFLMLALVAATAGAALYVLYRPHRPDFSILALRTGTLNLTTDSTASSSRLSTSFNLTLSSKNPNSHYFTFFYDPFAVTFLSSDVPVGNSSLPAFVSSPKNETVFKNIIVRASAQDLDTDSVKSLRSDLRRSSGIPLRIQMDTKVKVKAGKLKSKKVGIRVVCDGFKGVAAPKGKSPAVATVTDADCKVDLRIKIWKFTF